MARGKHEWNVKRNKQKKKSFSLLLGVMLLLAFAAGGTFAYIATSSAMTNNQFSEGYVIASVNHEGQVSNNGNVDAYIRAAVVVNWMDSDGNVYGIKPSYALTVNSGWTQIGDYYYYTKSVAANGETDTAPVTVSVSGNAPSGAYSLSIEVVAEAIQADGYTDTGDIPAYQNAWKISSIGS